MPEVHIVGEIEGASGFPSNNLFCKWKIVTNADDSNRWERLEGETEGQTQVDFPKVSITSPHLKRRTFPHRMGKWLFGVTLWMFILGIPIFFSLYLKHKNHISKGMASSFCPGLEPRHVSKK
jgi:hypothetical protein